MTRYQFRGGFYAWDTVGPVYRGWSNHWVEVVFRHPELKDPLIAKGANLALALEALGRKCDYYEIYDNAAEAA